MQVTNLRARGLKFLDVPDKYYTNLKERLKQSPVNVKEDIDMVRHWYTVWVKKIPPEIFWRFFSKRLGIFSSNFTCLSHVPIYAGLQIFIQLSATLTKLCYIKRDHHNVLKMSTVDRNPRWVVGLNMV